MAREVDGKRGKMSGFSVFSKVVPDGGGKRALGREKGAAAAGYLPRREMASCLSSCLRSGGQMVHLPPVSLESSV